MEESVAFYGTRVTHYLPHSLPYRCGSVHPCSRPVLMRTNGPNHHNFPQCRIYYTCAVSVRMGEGGRRREELCIYAGCKIYVLLRVTYNITEKSKCTTVTKHTVPKFLSREECRQRIEKKRSLCFQSPSIISTIQTFPSLFFHIKSMTFLSLHRDNFTFDTDTYEHFLVVSMRKLPSRLSKESYAYEYKSVG